MKLDDRVMRRMRIPARYWSADLSDFPEDDGGGQFTLLRRFAEGIHRNAAAGWGMLLYGPNGSGKTHAGVAMLRHAWRNLHYGAYVTAEELKSITIERTPFDDDQTLIQRCRTVPFLMIDDVGKEYQAASSFSEVQFENLLRERCQAKLSTIVTTNLIPQEFRKRYAESTVSLIREMMVALAFKGKDRRADKQAQKREELQRPC